MARPLALETIFTLLQKTKKLPQKSLNSKNTASSAASIQFIEKANKFSCFFFKIHHTFFQCCGGFSIYCFLNIIMIKLIMQIKS